MSVENELASLKSEVRELKDQMKELKKMKQQPRQKRQPSEYALFVAQFAKSHPGQPDLMKAASAAWKKKQGK